jgi:hypothetical protein
MVVGQSQELKPSMQCNQGGKPFRVKECKGKRRNASLDAARKKVCEHSWLFPMGFPVRSRKGTRYSCQETNLDQHVGRAITITLVIAGSRFQNEQRLGEKRLCFLLLHKLHHLFRIGRRLIRSRGVNAECLSCTGRRERTGARNLSQ